MKTLDKYLIKSFLGPMILTFFIVMFIFLMNIVWRFIDELVGKGLGLGVILEFLMYGMFTMIYMAIPLATLLAAIMTMGNLGENYELLAMKSAGISLQRIMRPIFIIVIFISIAGFFAANNLMPYSWRKMDQMRYDISKQQQVIEFHDGQFFNGIPDMSIRVEKQDKKTGLLHDVIIYDYSNSNTQTTIAESGFIRLSDDKRFLLVDLFDGERYETTRDRNWNTENKIQHQIFQTQELTIKTEGFDFQQSDADMFGNRPAAKSNPVLRREIDSLNVIVVKQAAQSYEPLLKNYLLTKDQSLMGMLDSVRTDYSYKEKVNVKDSIAKLDINRQKNIITKARTSANSSRGATSYDEDRAKQTLNQLYSNEIEWWRKMALPASIIIFFLIGAPLGAIIRKGGLGMPIVVSVIFFVFNYVISMFGEKLAKDGVWNAFEGMWLSSFILLPIAVYLTYKSANDSNLFNAEWYYDKYRKLKEKIAEGRTKNKKGNEPEGKSA